MQEYRLRNQEHPDNIATAMRKAFKSAYKLLRLSLDLVTAITDHA